MLKVFLLILQKHAFVKHVLVFLGMTHTQFSEIGANDLETKHARIAMRVQKIFIHPLLCTKKVTTRITIIFNHFIIIFTVFLEIWSIS